MLPRAAAAIAALLDRPVGEVTAALAANACRCFGFRAD